MLIRLGYEIAIECLQPTPLISLLEIHQDRQPDIKRQTRVLTSPSVPTSRLPRPVRQCLPPLRRAGRRRSASSTTRLSRTSGEPDEVNTLAARNAGREAARRVPRLPARQPLLRDRPHERHRLVPVRSSAAGLGAGAGDLSTIVHNRLSFGYGYARATRTAAQAHEERVGVCRDFAHLAITLCRCMNIPARYVNGYLGDIGVPADPAPMDFSAWFEVLLDGKWYTFDAAPQHAAHRPRRDRARPRRDRRAAAAQFRPASAVAVQGLDLRAGGRARADANATRRPHGHCADACVGTAHVTHLSRSSGSGLNRCGTT